MFSGIIETLGNVLQIKEESGRFFEITSKKNLDLKKGDSLAVNGVCLTASHIHSPKQLGAKTRTSARDSRSCSYVFFASKETLALTNLRFLNTESIVNLERPLVFGENGRLHGHLVMGHVDGTEKILAIKKNKQSCILTLSLGHASGGGRAYLILKGSVCLNGISLTVYRLHDDSFEVMIIPHTYQHTNLQYLKPGMEINIEYDMLAKYAENFYKLESAKNINKI